MDQDRLAELLRPFCAGAELSPYLLDQLRIYLDLLLRWNARMNLTAMRDPEQIATRHFGESLFAAEVIRASHRADESLADVGSGAGFPGIPIKLAMPDIGLTLIESQNKKATFLREVVRTLNLPGADVFSGRAEEWKETAGIVTLRAVEQFHRALPVAASLAAIQGSVALLIGASQVDAARLMLSHGWNWADPVPIPGSNARVVAVARRMGG
jgi:16S rRNA (guanine527-N7)-methyltransferase